MSSRRISIGLRTAAAALALASLATWAATGAHIGWTQTSVVELLRDEITGIEYPVRRSAFVAGLELLAGGLAGAATLAGLSFVAFRRRASVT
jgi:hypothetical protein